MCSFIYSGGFGPWARSSSHWTNLHLHTIQTQLLTSYINHYQTATSAAPTGTARIRAAPPPLIRTSPQFFGFTCVWISPLSCVDTVRAPDCGWLLSSGVISQHVADWTYAKATDVCRKTWFDSWKHGEHVIYGTRSAAHVNKRIPSFMWRSRTLRWVVSRCGAVTRRNQRRQSLLTNMFSSPSNKVLLH